MKSDSNYVFILVDWLNDTERWNDGWKSYVLPNRGDCFLEDSVSSRSDARVVPTRNARSLETFHACGDEEGENDNGLEDTNSNRGDGTLFYAVDLVQNRFLKHVTRETFVDRKTLRAACLAVVGYGKQNNRARWAVRAVQRKI